ncbi:uncharacterized protein LOC123307703 isoform X1 [Coccinella septempunctata]|uniref:uncharacterized protein LOC123307703 isoform X1 n=1 Tax=Coccinella septempunctata TaxID=41139 RepID=UPI001D05F38B|nr:uncharacterized protein LOC123307703 isoform X1 [Coccinella septempunctata]
MVNRCVVCKKISSKSSGKSMHRMPIYSARQKLWMDPLKLKISESSKWVYVCSDHFCDGDFILKFGKKSLKTEAIPSRISLPDPCSCCTSTASDGRSVTQTLSDIGRVEEFPKLSGSELSKTSTASELSAILTASDLSATITNSESSCTLAAADVSDTLVSSKLHDTKEFRARRKRKSFVGDVTEEDFRSPKRGKYAFSLAKRKIGEQKRALEAMRKRKRRLQQKISDL